MYITSYSIRIVLLSRYVNIYNTMAPMSVVYLLSLHEQLKVIDKGGGGEISMEFIDIAHFFCWMSSLFYVLYLWLEGTLQ